MERKRKIVVDSASNLVDGYIKDEKVGFKVVPLTIRIDGVDFVDEAGTDPRKMLEALHSAKEKTSTSCPSPEMYARAYADADDIIVITISGKMSGSTNAAYVGSLDLDGKRVHVIDSQGTAGSEILLVDKAYELMKTDMPFEKIEDAMDEFVKSIHLLFVLDSFESLYKAGRVSKILAVLGATMHIKGICMANGGDIKLYKKAHAMRKALMVMAEDIGNFASDFANRTCIISCTEEDENTERLKEDIKSRYQFKEIKVVPNRVLCSFYALEGGIIVSF